MGFSKKNQVDCGRESEAKKWVYSEIGICAPLQSISTKPKEGNDVVYHSDGERSTTPTSRDSRIPERLPCPPAPRKRPSASTCRYNGGGAREFFDPPDLESVFIRHVERAN